MNRFGKHSAWTVAVLSMLLMGTACSSDKNDSNASAAASPSASITAPASAGASDPADASPDASPADSAADALEGTGTYNGMGDANSIEIQFNGQPTVFRISPDIADKLSDWDTGIAVKFQYTQTTVESDGSSLQQYTIVSIDKQ